MREGWREVKLGDVAGIQQGVRVEHSSVGELQFPVLGATGVIGSWNASSHSDVRVAVGCRGTVGTVRLVEQPSWFGNNVMALWPLTSDLDIRFLALAIEDADLVRQGAVGGQVQKQITRTSLSPVRLPLPPLEVQRRIVGLVTTVDACLAAGDVLMSSAKAWYVAGASRLQQAGDESALVDLVSTARAGGTPSRKQPANYGGDTPWVKSGEVAGRVVTQTEETITEAALASSAAWLVPAGATLVAMYGATAGQVGRLGVEAATNQAVLALIADPERTDAYYLYHLLRSDGPRLKTLAKGAAQPNLSKSVLAAQKYSVPGLERQRELAQDMEAALAVCEAAREEASRLRDLRASLLSALLSGEHEIPDSYDELLAG